jgi:hypothetical protein
MPTTMKIRQISSKRSGIVAYPYRDCSEANEQRVHNALRGRS